MLCHQIEGCFPVSFGKCGQDIDMLPIAGAKPGVTVLTHLIRESLETPEPSDRFTHGKVSAKFRDHEVEGIVKIAGSTFPFPGLARFCVAGQLIEIRENFFGNLSGAGPGRNGFDQASHPVNIDKPVFRSRTDNGPPIRRLGHDSIRREASQSSHYRRPADLQLFRQLGTFQLRSRYQIASNDAKENLILDFIDEGMRFPAFGHDLVEGGVAIGLKG